MNKNVPIYIIGDLHNNFSYIMQIITKYDIKKSVFLCVGDFGAYWDNDDSNLYSLHNLNKVLIKQKIDLYTIRGNHDNPKNFDNRIYGNVHLVRDYSVLEFNGYRFLMVGGAHSIDVEHRFIPTTPIDDDTNIRDVLFEGEEFKLDKDKLFGLNNINVVITHTAPLGVYPHTIVRVKDNPELEEKLLRERQAMSEMESILIKKNNNLYKWFYGHFHTPNSEMKNDIEYICVGINEVKMLFL